MDGCPASSDSDFEPHDCVNTCQKSGLRLTAVASATEVLATFTWVKLSHLIEKHNEIEKEKKIKRTTHLMKL